MAIPFRTGRWEASGPGEKVLRNIRHPQPMHIPRVRRVDKGRFRCPQGCEVDTSGEGVAVDLVGKDAQGKRLIDNLVEAVERLRQALRPRCLWPIPPGGVGQNSPLSKLSPDATDFLCSHARYILMGHFPHSIPSWVSLPSQVGSSDTIVAHNIHPGSPCGFGPDASQSRVLFRNLGASCGSSLAVNLDRGWRLNVLTFRAPLHRPARRGLSTSGSAPGRGSKLTEGRPPTDSGKYQPSLSAIRSGAPVLGSR